MEKNTKPAQFWPKQPKPAQFCYTHFVRKR